MAIWIWFVMKVVGWVLIMVFMGHYSVFLWRREKKIQAMINDWEKNNKKDGGG